MIKLLIISAVLSSCSTTEPRLSIQEVKVPILHCPTPPEVQRPGLPIYSITDSDTDAQVVLKYEESVMLLDSYSRQLELVLDRYRKISHSQTK